MEASEELVGEPGCSAGCDVVVPASEVVCVEFPAFVRDVDKAIDMLGGQEALSMAENSKNPFLQLHWKPGDAFRHGIYGGRHAHQGLLLRMSRPKNSGGVCGEFKVEAVARVKATYKFQGLCDYGFGKKEELADQEAWVPGTVEPGKTSESLAVLPPLFSKEDLPLDYAFKLGKPTVAKKEQDKRYDMLYGGPSRNTRISFYSFGGVPGPRKFQSIDLETKECWDSVQKMLDERPIWSIDMLMHVVDGKWERSLVLAVLVGLAYKFRTGPWHNLFVRRGYDPRRDIASRKYQKVDYEFPQWDSTAEKRRVPKRMCLSKPSLDELHRFSALPDVLTTTFQVCDLEDPEIRSIVEEGDQHSMNCSAESGWFTEIQWKRIVKTVNDRFGFLFDSYVEHRNYEPNPQVRGSSAILPPELLDQVIAGLHSDSESSSSEKGTAEEAALDLDEGQDEGEAEDQAEDQAENQAEDQAEGQVEDRVINLVEDQVINLVEDEDEDQDGNQKDVDDMDVDDGLFDFSVTE